MINKSIHQSKPRLESHIYRDMFQHPVLLAGDVVCQSVSLVMLVYDWCPVLSLFYKCHFYSMIGYYIL
jgi:hypothetical protein